MTGERALKTRVRRPHEDCALPGLKIQTWGNHTLWKIPASRKLSEIRGRPPFRDKAAEGWGTQCSAADGREGARASHPSSDKAARWSTHLLWKIPASRNLDRTRPRSVVSGQEREGEVFGGGGAAARGFFEGGVAAVGGVLGLAAVENLLDGEDLEAGISAAVGRFVEPGLGGFFVVSCT